MIGDTKVVVSIVENGDLKKIVDDMKNANEKLYFTTSSKR